EALLRREADFVVPLTPKLHVVRRFLKHKKKKERIVTIKFTDSKDKRSVEITGRLMKKKIGDGYHVLFTSLSDSVKYTTKAIFDLYLKRWKVETCFLQLKNTLELASWTGATPLAIDQDFKANIFLYNLTRALTHKVRPDKKKKDQRNRDTKRKRTINFSLAVCRCKLLVKQILNGKSIEEAMLSFINTVRKCVEYSRVGQKQPRNYWTGKNYHLNQKHA
ncbi:MAG: hypothetical protein AAFY41_16300, partial [Bacteroidota bacterium]